MAAALLARSHTLRSGAPRRRSPASITTRQSFGGDASKASTAGAMLRPPAFTQTARRPPNSGIVFASSTSRPASPERSSPSSRTSEKGSSGSSTEALMIFSARSRTSPASAPKISTTGRAASGRATNFSMSADLSATIFSTSSRPMSAGAGMMTALRPGDEIGREPRLDILGDDLGGAGLGVAQAAQLGEALHLARNVIGDAGEGGSGHHRFAGSDFRQPIRSVETEIFQLGPGRE